MTDMHGAVQLPTAHLSVRVPWHDLDYTGRVCASPSTNHSCSVLKNIKENKVADREEQAAGEQWGDGLEESRVPPCAMERAGFMRPEAFTLIREHAYAQKGRNPQSHGHFRPTPHRMPAYSFEAVPFRWTNRDSAPGIADQWGIAYDQELEDRTDELMGWSSGWVQDHSNQRAMLDSFFSAINPQSSLVFVYAKDVPLLEDRPPGARILIGAGRVTSVGGLDEWSYGGEPSERPLRAYVWERAIGHSIRPSYSDGFVLPYQTLLGTRELLGEDLSRFVAHAPADHFEEFSMVSEHVGHDGAIGALTELARVVDLYPGVVDGPWPQVLQWVSDRLADTWELRGPFPGLGAALAAAGLDRGALIAYRVIAGLSDPSSDPWPHLEAAMNEAREGSGPVADLVGRMARKAWDRLLAHPERLALLKLLARLSLTGNQTRRLYDRKARSESGIDATDRDLLENPYRIFEVDRGRLDAIGLQTVDRALFPQDATARAALELSPLPEPVTESVDDRRVRAASVHLLEAAAADGHSLLDEPQLRRRLAGLDLQPPCDPPSDVFDIATEDFEPVLAPTPLAGDRGRGWQLSRLSAVGDLIAREVQGRIAAGPIDVNWDWRAAIDDAIGGDAGSDRLEEEARREKADALSALAKSRIGVLVGPAGTGKTTMLRSLCTHPDVAGRGVQLLAPTGKARVQLGDRVGQPAQTLAQFLRKSGRWDLEFGYRLRPEAPRKGGAATVVIDEASMLTEEMLAAVLDELIGVERLVLCGDHRQLPPIGAGRPFVDLVAHLRSLSAEDSGQPSGGTIAELTVSRRQTPGPGSESATRDDVAFASMFAVDTPSPASDQVFARVLSGEGDGTVSVHAWSDEEDLHNQVVDWLSADVALELAAGDPDSLRRSLGAYGTYNDRPSFEFGRGGEGAENWQLLSPVRARTGGVAGLNGLVRSTWRRGDVQTAIRSWKLPSPLGGDQVLFYDKVMCVHNHTRGRFDAIEWKRLEGKGHVANGEIGMAVHWAKKKGGGKPGGLKIEFSTQPGLQFTFWASESGFEGDSDFLELAYAVTVHKSQGSQFGTTIVVVPNPCPLLSPELLYTALTRQRDRVVIFMQGEPSELRALGDPSRSATARRLTRLFRPPDPFETPEGAVLDGALVHRTAQGDLVRSKSEVIVGNTLTALGLDYEYETLLQMEDGTQRLPDFTIRRPGAVPVYWEHLGMLGSAGYRADWEAKLAWYRQHGIMPWTEGAGEHGTLVWSTEQPDNRGIDSREIEELARQVFEVSR